MATDDTQDRPHVCSFVPPQLLRRLAANRPETSALLEAALVVDDRIRTRRRETPVGDAVQTALRLAPGAAWTVHDARNGTELPGRAVRRAGEPATGDDAVDEAARGLEQSLDLFRTAYARDSFDGRGAPVVATVHYGEDYVNAFWDGTQLVFGDGDGEVFARFTRSLDVVAHEFSHAVVQYTADLVYADQPGALNESVCDVFAACLDQRERGETAEQADWLIGRDLFLPGVQARALRDMARPGTAYDDPALGRDPQVGHMDDFVVTQDDNGGVHLNSGIPNRAFHLAATAIGGSSAEGAGAIWYAALTGSGVGPRTDFAGFAAATVAAAGRHEDAVREAWRQVGVAPGGDGPRGGGGQRPRGALTVTRSGGFAGMVEQGELDLGAGDDPRVEEVRALWDRVDLAAAQAQAPASAVPDGFVYAFTDPTGQRVELPEQALTDDLRSLAGLILPGRHRDGGGPV
ncbi:protealysin inhibitor emfourin [Nocardioides sp. CFH 31398]|uniref:protealysin inhibitor emfourin n=1 Tax=Nocardioides sp. CFH 31398 TaxID=2919579 RepID=UPI001F06E068|nr:protealysin inhibitor emfourin [Nocardioides sp. CFH 31398]MCH1865948.1 M4 family metallopeptidase [Nocardioides sp. CFH 31398]